MRYRPCTRGEGLLRTHHDCRLLVGATLLHGGCPQAFRGSPGFFPDPDEASTARTQHAGDRSTGREHHPVIRVRVLDGDDRG